MNQGWGLPVLPVLGILISLLRHRLANIRSPAAFGKSIGFAAAYERWWATQMEMVMNAKAYPVVLAGLLKGRLFSQLCAVILAALPGNRSNAAVTLTTDDFGDSSLWTPQTTGNGPAILQANNGLSLIIPVFSTPGAQDTISVGVQTTFLVHGDFTITMIVDYSLPVWPSQFGRFDNGVRLGIGAGSYGMERVSRDVEDVDLFQCGNLVPYVMTSDLSGSLRLQRIGSTLYGYHWINNVGWELVGSGAAPTQDWQAALAAWCPIGYPPSDVVVDFSNLQITADAIVPNSATSTAPTVTLTANPTTVSPARRPR